MRIDGTLTIDDFNEQFDAELPDADYHTVAGFVFGALGRAAGAGRRGRSTTAPSCSTSTRLEGQRDRAALDGHVRLAPGRGTRPGDEGCDRRRQSAVVVEKTGRIEPGA